MGNTPVRTYLLRGLAAVAFLILLPSGAAGQNNGSTIIRYPVDNSSSNSTGLLPGQMIERDTIDKALRPKKPLESFYFDDSTRARRIFSWTASMDDNNITLRDMDTTIAEFQRDYPFMRKGVGSASLGNVGGATIPLNYFDRPQFRNFSFLQAWASYLMTPEQILFYNARMPYTNISYQMSGQRAKEEQLFHAVISQNISPSSSINLDYNSDGMKGQYERQKALDRYFSANFAHTGKRYAIHGGYIYNVGDIQENGGIEDMRDVTDTVMDMTENIPVRLDAKADARNRYKGNTFYWTQSYGIPLRRQRATDELTLSKIPTVFVGQSFQYTAFKKIYSDAVKAPTGAAGEEESVPFYDHFYMSPDKTYDSIRQSMMDVKFFMQLQPYNRDGALGLVTAGIGDELNSYYYYVPEAYQGMYGKGGKQSKNSIYVYGKVEGAVSRYMRWSADAKLHMIGYRSGDFDVGGKLSLAAYIRNKPLTLDASVRFSLREPDFWQQNYFSNHFAWSNHFSQEKSTLITAAFRVPDVGLELGGSYALTKDKVYYGLNIVPEQYGDMLSVMGLYLRKDFRLGGFHLNHRVLMQWSSNQTVAPVPLLSADISYFFGFDVVKKVLYMQIGLDGRYNTEYYAYAYNPAIGQFYTQDQVKLGNYPSMDAFVSAKWKRLRLLLKLQHWNCNLFGGNRYFEVVNYPQNRMMFKIGLSWAFYD